ncbi:MAG: hypothetical protein OMM_01020 [Candidatus Magnetoglobus multicellularis str. Araruama]|uniref:histidine kinase n=1 Tax=Candidatus Magnetoglobus multicellularis str. Araruama TaxID=890399 RepID=A0A1V1PF13_9BACT|nr:MAG: hypothetical protein OMM_01020 [Candidatus Magnetoglobus multicellularis str. Araruama]
MDPSIIELTKKLERTEAILTALYQGELDAIVRASDIALIRNESSVRNTEYALEETRNNFQLLFNSLEDLLFIIDNNGNIIHHNIAVEQYLGYESDELTKMNFLQLHRQEDRSQLQKLMTPNAKEKLVQNRLLKKNGDLIYAETRLSQGAWSKKVVWFAIVRDITIRKQAEFEMKAAQKAAEDANKAKTEFFAKMTHELRTPLNGILGYSQMLIGDKSLKPSNQKAATIIHSSGEYLLSLINDLLDFSKIEAQQMKLYSESFDFQQMIQNVSELTIIGAQKKISLIRPTCMKMSPKSLWQMKNVCDRFY